MNTENKEAVSTQTEKPSKKAPVTKSRFAYDALLTTFPRPGGEGAHMALYKAGILGFRAGVRVEDIVGDVKCHIKPGSRIVSDKEIEQGVNAGFTRAVEEYTGLRQPESTKAAPKIPEGVFADIVSANAGVTIEDIMKRSPIPLDFPEWEAGWRTVQNLYDPGDFIYIGGAKEPGILGENIRTAADWVEELRRGPSDRPHIIVNPLTGELAPTKDGSGETMRGDRNVAKFRNLVLEMDGASIEDQLAFWSWIDLPVRALIMSGGKSIHGWVDADCKSVVEWEVEIENDIFPNYLVPLGADPACKNESRVSRMPGHIRADKNAMQKLIYLSPEGKAVSE